MKEISEIEIKSMTKEQNYMRGYDYTLATQEVNARYYSDKSKFIDIIATIFR